MAECNFVEHTKRLMFDAIKHSENQKRLFGFNLCLDSGNNIIPGSFVEGGKDSIRMLNSSCPQSTKKIGDFHTELFTGLLPSHLDILRQMTLGYKLLCIGTSSKFGQSGPITRDVTCFETKDMEKEKLAEIRKVISKNLPVLDKMKLMKPFISTKCTIKE